MPRQAGVGFHGLVAAEAWRRVGGGGAAGPLEETAGSRAVHMSASHLVR